MSPAEEIASLQDKLAARTDRNGNAKAGYSANVEHIKARIAELEAESEEG